jgi:hypothetical protein
MSMSRFGRPLLRSIGFGREKIDCPDLRAGRLASLPIRRREHSLSHDRCQSDKLEHIPRDEQQRVEQFFFFAGGTAPSEKDEEDGYRTYHGDDEVHYIERRLPKLLHPES